MRIFHFCAPLKSPSSPLGLSEVQNWCLRSMEILGCSLCLEAILPSVMKWFWNIWEYFLGFLSICCTARGAQCYIFCIHLISLHSSFQSQLLPIIFLNLHSTLLNIFCSVFFFPQKILYFYFLSIASSQKISEVLVLFSCVGELFNGNLSVFCFFKFPFILFLTILHKLYWFVLII